MNSVDVEKVAAAARNLSIEPRAERWCHPSLCVIDAVFSIGARYGSTWRAARRYADHAELRPVTAPSATLAADECVTSEQTLAAFLEQIGGLSDEDFAAILGNRQRTSSRGGILKSAAARQYAEVLNMNEIQTLGDVAVLLKDGDRTKRVESGLAGIRGHGSGVRVSYLWMLAGNDDHVKADRMVTGWTGGVLGRPISPREATELVVAAATLLEVTPWELDHAIWRLRSGRSALVS